MRCSNLDECHADDNDTDTDTANDTIMILGDT
jgi:hypothetical protein